jgi:predicted metal-binding protein
VSDQSLLASRTNASHPPGAALVSVCISCRAKTPDAAPPGIALEGTIKAALAARNVGATVRPVQCLSVCSRAATIAIQAPDGYTFLFGDLQTAEDADAIANFLASYTDADYGFVPWRERPLALRSKIVARLPPAIWSPADGRQPG